MAEERARETAERDGPVPPPVSGEEAYSMSARWVLDALGVDPARGLSEAEARRRRARHGSNRIGTHGEIAPLRILLDQFRGAIVLLLVGAAILSVWLGDLLEAAAIATVLAINAAIGFAMELRAAKSMAALRALARTTARVRRGGRVAEIDADALVPGDVVLLEAGDLVSADLRLLEATDLHCDESALTGESVPVAKGTEPLAVGRALAERRNMAYRGASITRGFAAGVVVHTGRATELGQIAELVAGAGDETSPLDRRLEGLGRQLSYATLAVAVGMALFGWLAGRDPLEMLRTGVALAVAAAPEGLPIVATLALARGMWRMAERNALVNRLASIETLGSTTVILTDKTGTLTENRMRLAALLLAGDGGATERLEGAEMAGTETTVAEGARAALRVAALANEPGAGGGFADPMEAALVEGAAAAGLDRGVLLAETPVEALAPFDPELKMMASLHETPEGPRAAVKGAPEAVLARARRLAGGAPLDDAARAALHAAIEAEARRGHRLLALAEGPGTAAAPYDDLALLGFACLADPARGDVAGSIAACRRAGVKVVMVTGDHPETARRIAADVGLVDRPDAAVCTLSEGRPAPLPPATEARDCRVFARVAPREKLDLVAEAQGRGEIVAMIGDGVNDAPALKKSDIGVAMGRRGTQVAAEAADIVLRDDAFASIVAALRQGRVIYGNIRLFVRYLMSCNLSEIMVVASAIAAGIPMPLLPLQLLYLNLVTDVFPALALGAGQGPRDVMDRPPRPPAEPIVSARDWREVALDGASLTLAVLAAIWAAGAHPVFAGTEPTAAAFLTLALAQLWQAIAMPWGEERRISNQASRNPWLWGAILLSLVLVGAAVFLAPLAAVLELSAPPPAGWALILVASLLGAGANAARRLLLPPQSAQRISRAIGA